MQCGVEVTSNDPALLSYLAKHPEKSSWFIRADGETYYLVSPNFQGLANAADVWQAADDLLFVLNGIMKLKFKYAQLIRGSTVAYFDPNGQVIRASVSKDVQLRLNVSAGEPSFQSADARNPSSMAVWMKAQNDPLVEEALQHYTNEHNWFNLYKVYELIKKETCRAEEKRTKDRGTLEKWTKGRKLDFEESANRGRHSSLGYQPRPGVTITYMSLQEADDFIIDLLLLWLQAK